MEPDRLRHKAVALIAAYAVALQTMLSAFLPIAPAVMALPFAELCMQDRTGGTSPPMRHDLPCAAICAALAHGISGPLPSDVVVADVTPRAGVATAPVDYWVPPGIAIKGPQAPRGPPLA
jgi:hypothetical protein